MMEFLNWAAVHWVLFIWMMLFGSLCVRMVGATVIYSAREFRRIFKDDK